MARELRDPIHGFIERSRTEEKIIDTPVFQRLRGVKQLAFANLVYPGANHTRFDHSIGVMHVAGRLATQLLPKNDPEEIKIVRLAALLHDIGHGPFSHVAEEILEKYFDPNSLPTNREKIHEIITYKIIESDPDLAALISDFEKERILQILNGTYSNSFVRGIVSGHLDADKQDYLLRDSYFCGVKYGVYDLERLIGILTVKDDHYNQFLAASQDGVYAVEQYVIAKYHMSTQVYRHKIRLISDSMITRAFELGIEIDQLDWMKKLFTFQDSAEFLKNYLSWNDSRVITALLFPMGAPGLASELFWRLTNRRLFKRVFSKRIAEFPDGLRKKLLVDSLKSETFRKEVEKEIAEYLSSKTGKAVPADFVIVKGFTIKSVKEQSRDTEGSIMILTDSGQPQKFEDVSTLFRSINEKENDYFVDVYAPCSYKDSLSKLRLLEEFAADITGILSKRFDNQLSLGYTKE